MGNRQSKPVGDKMSLLTSGYVHHIAKKNRMKVNIPKPLIQIIYKYIYHGIQEWIDNVICDQTVRTVQSGANPPDIEFTSNKNVGLIFNYPKINCGIWKFEMEVVTRPWAMAIGIVKSIDDNYDRNSDAEFEDKFYGYYHGGYSINMCANGERVCDRIPRGKNWEWAGNKVGVLVDFDKNTMIPVHPAHAFDPTQYVAEIPSDTYCFQIWIGRAGGKIIVHPPQKVENKSTTTKK